MKSFRNYLMALAMISFLFSCSDDNDDDDSGAGPSNTSTLIITSADGDWTTSELKIYDQGSSLLSFEASSDEGGSLLWPFFFDGEDSYSFDGSGFGSWAFTFDQTTNYATGFGSPGSGAIAVIDHDASGNRLSGGIDLTLPEFNNPSNTVHLEGSFENVQIEPISEEVQDVSIMINGAAFDYDYVVTKVSGLEVYLHVVKNVRERVVIRLARTSIMSGGVYANGFSTPVGVTYNLGTDQWTEVIDGVMNIDEHFAGAFPDEEGMTTGDFSFDIGDNNSGTMTVSGTFDVHYGF